MTPTAASTFLPRAAAIAAALTFAVAASGLAHAQGNSTDNRSATREAPAAGSTPGRAPSNASTPGRSGDNRSTTGATNSSRSTDGRANASERSTPGASKADSRSRSPSN
jgi:hypothetical protein